jgi:hypothetical protein
VREIATMALLLTRNRCAQSRSEELCDHLYVNMQRRGILLSNMRAAHRAVTVGNSSMNEERRYRTKSIKNLHICTDCTLGSSADDKTVSKNV